jgi:hypothetical protein
MPDQSVLTVIFAFILLLGVAARAANWFLAEREAAGI